MSCNNKETTQEIFARIDAGLERLEESINMSKKILKEKKKKKEEVQSKPSSQGSILEGFYELD